MTTPPERLVKGRSALSRLLEAAERESAPPPVALEWCLPLVDEGGAAILYVGPSADVGAVARAAERLAGAPPEVHAGLLVIRKVGPTPPGRVNSWKRCLRVGSSSSAVALGRMSSRSLRRLSSASRRSTDW